MPRRRVRHYYSAQSEYKMQRVGRRRGMMQIARVEKRLKKRKEETAYKPTVRRRPARKR